MQLVHNRWAAENTLEIGFIGAAATTQETFNQLILRMSYKD